MKSRPFIVYLPLLIQLTFADVRFNEIPAVNITDNRLVESIKLNGSDLLTSNNLTTNDHSISDNVTTNDHPISDNVGGKVTSDDKADDEVSVDTISSPDLFGRRFINFLSRRKGGKSKVSRQDSIRNQYLKFAQSVKETTDDFLSTFLPLILKSLSDIELSDTCSQQIYRVIQGIYNQEIWAFKRKNYSFSLFLFHYFFLSFLFWSVCC